MGWWKIVRIAAALVCVGMGLFAKEFRPIGWTTALIWGRDKNARIPRYVAGPFYVLLGLLCLYWVFTEK
jgi:hypothetical protein